MLATEIGRQSYRITWDAAEDCPGLLVMSLLFLDVILFLSAMPAGTLILLRSGLACGVVLWWGFYGERQPVIGTGQRHVHGVDVCREDAGRRMGEAVWWWRVERLVSWAEGSVWPGTSYTGQIRNIFNWIRKLKHQHIETEHWTHGDIDPVWPGYRDRDSCRGCEKPPG